MVGKTREQRLIAQMQKQQSRVQQQTPIASNIFIPNHSGSHNAGRVTQTPTTDYQISNKKYVDDSIAAADPPTEVDENVRNVSGATLTKGTPVYITGWNSGQNRFTVDKADANGSSTMPAIGLVSADISNNSNGMIVLEGELSDVDTSSYSVNDALYVSTTAGTLTNTKPSGTTDEIQKMAIVARSHASNGVLMVTGAGRTNDLPNSSSVNMTLTSDNNTNDTQYTLQALQAIE